MGELILVFGLLSIAVALQPQPWYRQLRNPLIALGSGLSIAGLAIIYPPSLKVMLIGLPIGGFLLMIRHIICHWSEYHGKDIAHPIAVHELSSDTAVDLPDVSPPAVEDHNLSPRPIEAHYVPGPLIDGRLMVLRHDGQPPPPVPGSNRQWG